MRDDRRAMYADAVAEAVTTQDLLDAGFDVLEPKYDGQWVKIRIGPNGGMLLTSRSGKVVAESRTNLRFASSVPSIILEGEWMQGTERAAAMGKRLIVWGCWSDQHGEVSTRESYAKAIAVVQALLDGPVDVDFPVEIGSRYYLDLPHSSFEHVWQAEVGGRGREGLVAKNTDDPDHGYLRIKVREEYDAVVVGSKNKKLLCQVKQGQQGRDTAEWPEWCISAGTTKHMRDRLAQDRDCMNGMTVTLAANGVHASGLPRHGRFVRFHPRSTVL